MNNILLLLAFLAASTTSTSIHPNVPNPLFTPPPSPTTTITIDASTRIMGHCNTIYMPSSPASTPESGISSLLTSALRNLPTSPAAPTSPFGNGWGGLPSPRFDVKVQAGVSVVGSRNLVVLGGSGKLAAGLKRKAEVVSFFPPYFMIKDVLMKTAQELEDVPLARKVVKKEM